MAEHLLEPHEVRTALQGVRGEAMPQQILKFKFAAP